MVNTPIPVLEVRGTHYEVGLQIGNKLKERLQPHVSQIDQYFLAGMTRDDLIHKTRLLLTYSQSVYPQYVEEIEGIAEGADLPFEETFMNFCEDLWGLPMWNPVDTGCTDIASRGRATIDGTTLLGHTNDVSNKIDEDDLIILKMKAGDEPEILGVSFCGIGISAGFNAAGISLTGNQVNSNDVRMGVPRDLMVRAILGSRRLGEAIDHCLQPKRASNYNNIIADMNGEVYSMEGSATDCEAIYIENDILAHSNHFITQAMRGFELDRNKTGGSILHYNRAMRLLRENFGSLSPETFIKILSDHADYPNSICKHDGVSITAFGIIIKLDDLHAWIGRGRPCETIWTEHWLDPCTA
jgi:isopenicillin-N N-acyltransferase-like protein